MVDGSMSRFCGRQFVAHSCVNGESVAHRCGDGPFDPAAVSGIARIVREPDSIYRPHDMVKKLA